MQHKETAKPRAIRLTSKGLAAAWRLKQEDRSREHLALRVYIEGKGCDGFYYGVAFDATANNDLHFDHDGLDVVIDPDSFLFMEGSVIDWVDDERGTGFLVDNPKQNKFRGKFYKKKFWQEKFSATKPANELS